MNTVVTGIRTETKRVRPEIKQFKIIGLKPEDARLNDWWWINMMKLLNSLCGIVVERRLMPSVSVPSDFFDRYGLLCKPQNGKALLTWIAADTYSVDTIYRPRDEERHVIQLPSGFANAALDLAYQGIFKVTTRRTKCLGEYRLIGHHIDGSTCKIIRQEEYGPFKIV